MRKSISGYLQGDRTGATAWRVSRIGSLGRLFLGVTRINTKARYLRRSTTVRTFTPGARYLTRSGPSLAVKVPGLPFEVIVGYWKAYVYNMFADSPGVETVSVQAPGGDDDTAVPIAEYLQQKDAHPPTPFTAIDTSAPRPWATPLRSDVKYWPNG